MKPDLHNVDPKFVSLVPAYKEVALVHGGQDNGVQMPNEETEYLEMPNETEYQEIPNEEDAYQETPNEGNKYVEMPNEDNGYLW
jgi:hypothetical protein